VEVKGPSDLGITYFSTPKSISYSFDVSAYLESKLNINANTLLEAAASPG
jgi:hypothetical protein